MFDFISREDQAVPHQDAVPLLISSAVHLVMIGAVAAIALLYVSTEVPQVPDMLTFVAAAPAPPPPPPPPPPAKAATRPRPVSKPVPSVARVVPVEPPAEIVATSGALESETDEGIPGGVEGGLPGGILGGVVGGILTPDVVAPPPPPSRPVARAPVRVGGAITAPALLTRIEPVYPPLAAKAHVQGIVILEAVVDGHGRVEKVTVLRSIPLLDRAATEAVRQWRYSPLLLNGQPERFVLTVTVSFSLNG
jgi:periplasmic protein TonB